MRFFFFYIFTITNIESLIIRSGNFRYLPSVFPSNDIKLLNAEQTKIISNTWLQDIVKDIVSTKKQNNSSLLTEDIHLVTDINKLEPYFEDYNTSNKIFLGWAPKTKNKAEEIIYIIVAEHNTTNNHFNINHVVQSPYWDSNQIESIYLKIALLHVVNVKNFSALNLVNLYKNNIRHYLAWEIWFKK